MPQIAISRMHRYRNQTMRSAFGKGVYAWWDKWLVLNRQASDGSGSLELQTPNRVVQSTTFRAISGQAGAYVPNTGNVASAQLYDAQGNPVADQAQAHRAIVRDPAGNQMEFEIVNFSGNPTTARRDGRLIAFRDARGHAVSIDYIYSANATTTEMGNDRSRLRFLAKATDPYGQHIDFEWNNNGTVRTIALPTGRSVQYAYNANGFLTQVTHADGAITTVAFDAVAAPNLQTVVYDDPAAVNAAMHRHKRVWLATPTWTNPQCREL